MVLSRMMSRGDQFCVSSQIKERDGSNLLLYTCDTAVGSKTNKRGCCCCKQERLLRETMHKRGVLTYSKTTESQLKD